MELMMELTQTLVTDLPMTTHREIQTNHHDHSNGHLPEPGEHKRFFLYRIEDESGVSGTGLVAEGTMFSSGKCVLGWTRKYRSVAVYDSLEALEYIHGHNGRTLIHWVD